MSLRTQLTLFTALLVAAAVIIVSLVAYYAAQDRLVSQIDDSLTARSKMIAGGAGLPRRGPGGGGRPDGADGGRGGGPDPFAQNDTFFQVIDTTGAIVAAPVGQVLPIPVGKDDVAVATSGQGAFLHEATSGGTHLRVLTSPGDAGEAVQIGRSLSEVDASLRGLRNILFGVSGAGVILAALLGLLVAQRSLRPVARLTAAAEHVANTQDLTAKIEVTRTDEIGRLAQSFNAMLQALSQSRQQQHQLVTDAGHELRTPLTSLRTNIEVLARADDLAAADRKEILANATFELEELSKLVNELVELASDSRTEAREFDDVRLDQLAAALVTRAARRSGLAIALDATPSLVVGNHGLLERAASNLIDNACKWSPAGASIQVSVHGGRFEVRDHGAGIPPGDREHVFERFYRSDAARAKPGSGLGLAIVKQIVDAHDGRVWVDAAPGGGTIAGFELPAVPVEM